MGAWSMHGQINNGTCKPENNKHMSNWAHPSKHYASADAEHMVTCVIEHYMSAVASHSCTCGWARFVSSCKSHCCTCHWATAWCRTDAGGLDMNRLWGCASLALEPALFHVLQLLQRWQVGTGLLHIPSPSSLETKILSLTILLVNLIMFVYTQTCVGTQPDMPPSRPTHRSGCL